MGVEYVQNGRPRHQRARMIAENLSVVCSELFFILRASSVYKDTKTLTCDWPTGRRWT